MNMIANNIANANTTGFRQQGMIFSEYVRRADGDQSVAMSDAQVRRTSFEQGVVELTGGAFDFAIEGEGFFLIQSPQGERLSRAGAFTPSAEGTLVTPDGHPVLDEGGAPLFLPPGSRDFAVAQDGTVSAQGRPVGRLGVVRPLDPLDLVREGGTMFRTDAGFEPVENPQVRQGFLEGSNVNPILQISRMIEVQRAYELGQSLLEREDERVRTALKTFIK